MAKAYDRARTREFIPSCDKGLPPAEQTAFILGWLSVFDFTAIEEAFAKNPDNPGAFPKLIEIVRRALRGWKRFPMPDGTEAAFVKGDDGLATTATIGLIGPKEIMEMARDCDAQERLAPDDVGKS